MALQAETYLQEGYAIYAMDMVGHGLSEGRRWYMPNGDVMINDFIHFVQKVSAMHNNSDIPLFLSGYSYGGCLCLKTAKFFQDHPSQAPRDFKGLILQAPAVYDLECFYLFRAVAWVAQNIVIPVLGATFRPPDFIPNRVHPKRFWRDQERYRLGMVHNGLNAAGRHIPLQTCLTLLQDMIITRNKIIPGLQIPFCVVHGGCDKVVPYSGSKYLLRASLTPKEDQAFKFFPAAFHDMLAEPEAVEVMKFQVEWIQTRL